MSTTRKTRSNPTRSAKGTSRTTAQGRDVTPMAWSTVQAADRLVRSLSHQQINAAWDASKITDENIKHWSEADALSANASLSLAVRKTIRERARYEVANNCYAAGMVQTIADDTVGVGPRLEMCTEDDKLNEQIEALWHAWCRRTGLNRKLLLMQMARVTDGEAFALLANNPAIKGPIQLDVRLFEADRVTTPTFGIIDPLLEIDGLKFDEYGNTVSYSILKYHPGDYYAKPFERDEVPADRVLHLFRPTRPGQSRGVCEIAASLPLFAILRRFTLAVLGAAETAANLAAILYTDTPAGGEADSAAPFDPIDIERRAMTTLPAGWKMSQFKAEQPAATYEMFKGEILKEAARPVKMPANAVMGDSSKYNFASGRLDHIVYNRSIELRRQETVDLVLDRIFDEWFEELVLIEGLLPASMRNLDSECPRHEWMWPGNDVADAAGEANATNTALANFTTTYKRVYAAQGLDWKDQLKQVKVEKDLLRDEYELQTPIVPGSQPSQGPREVPSKPPAKKPVTPSGQEPTNED